MGVMFVIPVPADYYLDALISSNCDVFGIASRPTGSVDL